ncbi:MAG: hypothetical protein P1R58_08470 [bacterium]|nr:hypothetical protein [bacterium]
MSLKKRLKRSATVVLTRTFLFTFNSIPRRAAMALGTFIGLLAWSLLPRDRYRIDRHLKAVYGDKKNSRERKIIGRNFFVHSGKNLAEILRFRKFFETEIKPLVEIEGLEHFDRVHRRGKGVFGVAGHLGNFELLAVTMTAQGYKAAVIGREMYDKRLDDLLVANREAMGLVNISTTDSPRRILQWLQDGGTVGVLIDTDSMRVRSEMIPAFGRLSNTPIGQSLMALKTGAGIVPMACVRVNNDKYRLIIRPEVTIEPTGDLENDAAILTQKCTAALEELIDSYCDQWIWLHNRWHTRPEQSKNGSESY